VLQLGDERNPAVVLESLYRLGIRRIDVIETNGSSTSAVVAQVRQRVDVDYVVDQATGLGVDE
jgi:hypothetical protein